MQEFNKVTTTSNFIKNLLISTYLPLIRTVRDFDFIIADRLYVYRCEIIKCTKSGYLVTGFKNMNFEGERAQYRTITEYYFGDKNDKLCTNFISNSEGYDSLTHERLGKYLRSLRDMYDLNLMPLYNCFSNSIFQAHHISKSFVEKTGFEYNTKVYKVPIRFNTDYTICMENLGITTFAPAFIKNNNLILLNNTRFGNGTDVTNKYIKLHRTGVIQSKANLRFKEPFVIRFDNIPQTKRVLYYEQSDGQLDNLHNDNYYMMATDDKLPRLMYYIKNNNTYDFISELTETEFNENKLKYWYNNNGIITQCTESSEFDSSTIYYILSSYLGSTYLPTDLTPETPDLDVQLYIGIDPSTGRLDSTYSSRIYFQQGDNDTLLTDIETENIDNTLIQDNSDIQSIVNNNRTLEIEVLPNKLYDTPQFMIINLWNRCKKSQLYDPTEEYYIRNNGVFEVWDYELGADTFNANKEFYYIKVANQYIQCTEGDIYSSDTTYYVYYNDEYITSKEYYFIQNTTDFYTAIGFNGHAENYYLVQNNSFIQLSSGDEFDINSTYAIKSKMEKFSWRVKNNEGDLVTTNDRYMVEGTVYYSAYTLNTPEYYVYDITEENCALYDYVEDNLYLLIQVPKSYESSIVILEGDYTNTQSEKILDDSEVEMLPTPLIDYLYTSNLKLLEMPTSKPIPFSDTLIEFLLWNAINNLDSINNNMDRLLLAISRIIEDPSLNRFANYWYAQYRKLVSDIGRNYNNIVVRDNLGYVTKNLEQVINTTTNADSYINDYPYGN